MTIEQFKQSHNFSLNEERYQGGKIIDMGLIVNKLYFTNASKYIPLNVLL